MKKIALIVENYYPSMSGVPVVMQYLAEGLVQYGYAVDVLTCGYIHHKKHPKEDTHNGVNIFRYYIQQTPFYKLLGSPEEIKAFVQKACSPEYECVIITCAQCWTTNALLSKLKFIQGKKIFYTHGYSGLSFRIEWGQNPKRFLGSCYRYFWMKRYYRRMPRYLKQFDHIVYISEHDSAKDFSDLHGITYGVVIDNAVEDRFFADTTRSEKEKYLLNVSNYTFVKNQEMLLEAFYMADTQDYALILIGSVVTEYTNRLRRLQKEFEQKYGCKSVQILHHIDRDKIPEFVGNAFAFAMSSTWEQYSIALCEAMAKGIPFISTDVGNARFLPGGIIVNTKEQMAEAISSLIKNPEEARRLGSVGHEFALKHNKREVAIRALIDLIEKKK